VFTTLTNWLRPVSKKPRSRPNGLGARLETLEDRTVPDATYYPLINNGGTFSENWQTDYFVGKNASWANVPSIEGYSINTGVSPGTNPSTLTGAGSLLGVEGDQPDASTPQAVGIAEFQLTDRTVGLAGSSTHQAPYLQFNLDTRSTGDVSVSFRLRDLDANNNSVSPFALQYRVSTDGNFAGISFTNVASGFVADATGSGANKTTDVTALLPGEANDKQYVQVRIITADATNGGTDVADEWVGVDDILIHGNVQPVITLNTTKLDYLENAPITFIDSGMGIVDNDSNDFQGGKLVVNYAAVPTADDRIVVNNQGVGVGNISWTGTVATGLSIQFTTGAGTATIGTANPNGGVATTPLIITFTSAATPGAVRALLRNIGYLNVSDDPVGGIRTVQFTISDGDSSTGQTSTTVSRPVNVIPVNDSPIVTLPGGPLSVPEGAVPINIDPTAGITDPDSHDYDGGTITVSLPVGATTSDFLTIQNQGTGAGQVGIIPDAKVLFAGEVTYSGIVIGTYAGGDAGNPLVITFNAASTNSPTCIQAVARAIQFQNTSDFPPINPRPLRFIVNDGDADAYGNGQSTPVQVTITIQPTNDSPVLAPSRAGFSYTENDTATAIDSAMTLADPDSIDFNSGTIVADYVSGGSADDRLTVRNQGTGIGQVSVAGAAVSYNFGTGPVVVGSITSSGVGSAKLQVTFNPSATQPAVLAVLQAVSFSNVSDNPTTTPRVVRIVISDGDGGASTPITWNVTVDSVNDGPTIGNVPSSLVPDYSAGFPAVVLAPTATVVDPDNANFSTGNLTITSAGGLPADAIGIRNQGGGTGRIGLNGSNVTYGGVTIGSFTGGTGGAPLVVTLNASATAAAVQALAASITFRTPNGPGVTGLRTITFSALDFTSGTISNLPTISVDVTSTAGPNDDFFETDEDVPLSKLAGTITANDPNPGQISVATTPVVPPTKGTLTLGNDGSFQYSPNADANGTDTFTYAWFNSTLSTTGNAVVTIIINAVNDAPAVVLPSATISVLEDSGAYSNPTFVTPNAGGVVFRPGPDTAVDEVGQTVTRTVSNNHPEYFGIQPAIDATGKLTFTPAANASGTVIVTISMQDSGGTFANINDRDSAQQTFTINILPVNDAPTFQILGTPPSTPEDAGPQTVSGYAFNFQPGPATAVDEAAQTPTYILTAIGTTGGLTFTTAPSINAAGDLTFTAAPNANGTASFIVQVRDSGGVLNGGVDISAPRTFTITIGAVDDPPTVVDDSASVIWNSDPNTIAVLANDSGAPDAGDTVAVLSVVQPANGAVVVLPGGKGVTYQPNRGFVGTDTFVYTAKDSQGNTANATVTVNVVRYQTQPVDIVAVGSGENGDSRIRLYDSKTGKFVGGFSAYPNFEGSVSVATADVNGDGVPDIIVGAGPGGGPHIQIVDGNRIGLLQGLDQIAPPSAMLGNFFGYDFSFRGGVTVASGDVNGDGKSDIILGTGAGGAAHVKIISGAKITSIGGDLQPTPDAILASYFAYDPSFRGGVKVATGDVNSDGYFDIITSAGPGGASHVKVFSGRKLIEGGSNAPGVLLASFFAFDPNFRGGATIAAGDLNGDGYDDIIVGAGPGGGSHVKVFSPFNLATPIASFFAFEPGFNGGVNVGYRMRSGGSSPLLLAGSGPGSQSRLATFAPPNFNTAGTVDIFSDSFLGGVDVG
jgi:VCBS repeat-containing protein